MHHERLDNSVSVAKVVALLQGVRALDLVELEGLVQQAHKCDIHCEDDPPQRFPITRQALRMFWHFRCNIESVDVRVEVDE